MDLFEQCILSSTTVADVTNNINKFKKMADATHREIDYISGLICQGNYWTDTKLAELENDCNKLFARLNDYKKAIRLCETYCGMNPVVIRRKKNEMELVWERSADK